MGHTWIEEVLADLAAYAAMNDLDDLAEDLADLQARAQSYFSREPLRSTTTGLEFCTGRTMASNVVFMRRPE